jgi:polyhydroxybutyrate depolymerase
MRAPFLFLCTLLTMACSSTTTNPPGDGTATNTSAASPSVNPYGEAKNCPVFATGTVDTKAGGTERTLEVELPATPEGAPVVLAWHWLGGNASELLDWMGIRSLADAGYIVVAPEADGTQPYEWNTFDPGEDNADLALIDKMLPCLYDQFSIDPEAVFATGHSAGGLFTSFLTMHRADVLAATAPFSGGADSWSYSTPDQPISALVTWGDPSDTYAGYSFHDASLTLISSLQSDGSYPIACEHTGGHTWPAETTDMLTEFFGDHRLGQPSDWMSGLPAGMPAFCSL